MHAAYARELAKELLYVDFNRVPDVGSRRLVGLVDHEFKYRGLALASDGLMLRVWLRVERAPMRVSPLGSRIVEGLRMTMSILRRM